MPKELYEEDNSIEAKVTCLCKELTHWKKKKKKKKVTCLSVLTGVLYKKNEL